MIPNRRDAARKVRVDAADLARKRPDQFHFVNGDEAAYAMAKYPMSFSKGLRHEKSTLLVKDANDFVAFRRAIDNGYVAPFNAIDTDQDPGRKWEAPTAGFVHDLEGPDAQEVTMPAAPALGELELTYEMAEVYELALLRDVDFNAFAEGTNDDQVKDAAARLNGLGVPGSTFHSARPRPLDGGEVTPQTLFRGSSPGVEVGPYLSQFLLMGNDVLGDKAEGPQSGQIMFGAQRIDQRVPVAKPGKDYLMDEDSYLKAQNGKDLRDNDVLFADNPGPRFIQTPRDLATYVHDDALYQAYLNACLILLSQKAPFDRNFDHLSGMGSSEMAHAGGFALWGGPHILTLVTEVATRALKAVRYQKFNKHLRLRPEALAARLHKASKLEADYPVLKSHLSAMRHALSQDYGTPISLLDAIQKNNQAQSSKKTHLLPMAFQEGSPMHPTYGAGHATVAGACVTVLKAFFDTEAHLIKGKRGGKTVIGFQHLAPKDKGVIFTVVPDGDGNTLTAETGSAPLKLEHELNKLAANISIGRNMAGVHYYSDYYNSLRMGEEIAIGLLEEQALTYPKDKFVMELRTFDGDWKQIGTHEAVA